jgi:hypothetical protein
MSVESRGLFTSQITDYLKIGEQLVLYGHNAYPYMAYNETSVGLVSLDFASDWITTPFLSAPKGFLLYFERNNLRIKIF